MNSPISKKYEKEEDFVYEIQFECKKCPGKLFREDEKAEHRLFHQRLKKQLKLQEEREKADAEHSKTGAKSNKETASMITSQVSPIGTITSPAKGPALKTNLSKELYKKQTRDESIIGLFDLSSSRVDELSSSSSCSSSPPPTPPPPKKQKKDPQKKEGPLKWDLPPVGLIRNSIEYTTKIFPIASHNGHNPTIKMPKVTVNFDTAQLQAENSLSYQIGSVKIQLQPSLEANKQKSLNLTSQFKRNFNPMNIQKVFPGLSELSIYSPVYVVSQRNRLGYGGETIVPRKAKPVSSYETFTTKRFILFKTKKEEEEEELYKAKEKERASGGYGIKINEFEPSGDGLFCYNIISVNDSFDLDWFRSLTNSSTFRVDLDNFDSHSGIMSLNVHLLNDCIHGSHDFSSMPDSGYKMARTLSNFFNVVPFIPFTAEKSKEDIPWFFRQIKAFHDTEELTELPSYSSENSNPIQHPALLPILKDYQAKAIHWMLYKEGLVRNASLEENVDLVQAFLSRIFSPVILKQSNGDQKTAFYNRFLGYVCWELPYLPPASKAGILADEMGLGKTVEILALVLHNPRPKDQLTRWRNPDGVPNPFTADNDDYLEDQLENKVTKSLKIISVEDYRIKLKEKKGLICVCGTLFNGKSDILTCSKCGTQQHSVCVKHNPVWRTKREGYQYFCQNCITTEPPVLAKSTLIVTPSNISSQWKDEIERHIEKGKLSVFFYHGIKQKDYIPPEKLASYDVVITTYEILQAEITYLNPKKDFYPFRHTRRYPVIPSPLPHVEWWRVCLDEAQMIQGVVSNMSKMAQVLRAIQRWCVTGTPMNKGVEDLYGQICFMDVHPIKETKWWQLLICEPYYNRELSLFYDLFGQLIWRTEKQHIAEGDINIPPQKWIVHRLEFSPVEAYFYAREQNSCSTEIKSHIDQLVQCGRVTSTTLLSEINRQNLQALMRPFLRLRQTCCHPNMLADYGSNKTPEIFKNLQSSGLGLEAVMKDLIKSTRKDVLTSFKSLVILIKTIAEKYCQNQDWVTAASHYKSICLISNNFEHILNSYPFKTLQAIQSLLILHKESCYNFNLSSEEFAIKESEIEKWKTMYLKDSTEQRESAKETLNTATIIVNSLGVQLLGNGNGAECWWITVLKSSNKRLDGDSIKLFDMLKTEADVREIEISSLQSRLLAEINTLIKTRASLTNQIKNKNFSIELEQYMNLSTSKKPCSLESCQFQLAATCPLCSLKQRLIEYEILLYGKARTNMKLKKKTKEKEVWDDLTSKQQEKHLFALEEQFNQEEDVEEQENPYSLESKTEAALRVLLSFARKYKMSSDLISLAETTFEHYKMLKNECDSKRTFLNALYSENAKRLKLEIDVSEIEKNLNPNSNPKSKVNYPEVIKARDKEKITKATAELERGGGKLRYLQFLCSNGYGKNSNFQEDKCIICFEDVEKFYFLNCGHHFCIVCMNHVCPGSETRFSCPICREVSDRDKIYLLDAKTKLSQNQVSSGSIEATHSVKRVNKRPFIGDHSSKVEAIVETLLGLKETHSNEKVLVFSQWGDFLDIIAQALRMNKLSYLEIKGSKATNHEIIAKFKTDPDIQTLLLPLAAGCKGLNLTEATHVILAEPNLNTASELQAVGRVHRFGQTKETMVHRFFIKSSIEEQLYNALLGTKNVFNLKDAEGILTVGDLRAIIDNVDSAY